MHAYDRDGNVIESGQVIKSRLGDLYVFRYATTRTTPSAFGRIMVAKVTNSDASLHLFGPITGHGNINFADFAFSLTVR